MSESYSATRVQVMRTKLIRAEEYERLLKMSGVEILGYLQSTEYRQDIDALSIRDLENLENIDKVLTHNMNRVLAKLSSISGKEFKIALHDFLRENDAWNIKIIAESLTTGASPKDELQRYAQYGTFDPQQYAGVKSIEELSRKAGKHFKSLRRHPKTLAALCDALKAERAAAFAADKYLIDEKNIMQLLILKRDRLAPEQIMQRLQRGGTVPRSILRQAASGSFEDAIKTLRSTKYGKSITDDLVKLEYELHRAVLRRIQRAAGRYPLGPEVVVQYIIEKEREIENIRLLIKGKQLDVDESFIKEQLAWS